MIKHKDSARLESRLKGLLSDAIEWKGIGYRSVSTQYATSKDILTGVGSQKNGGRWNPLDSFPTVYLSLEHDTAFDESFAHVAYYGLQPQDVLPRTFVAVSISLHQILDLTDAAILKRLKISRRAIVKLDWRSMQDAGEEALTQAIGRLANEAGFEGLLVPSSASKKGRNIIIFPDSLLSESTARVLNPEKLKPIH